LNPAIGETVSVLALIVVLAWAVIRPRGWPEAVAAGPAAVILVAVGAISAGVEYVVFGRFFRSDLSPGSAGAQRAPGDDPHAVLLAGQPGWARTGCQPMTLAENLPSLLRADISLT